MSVISNAKSMCFPNLQGKLKVNSFAAIGKSFVGACCDVAEGQVRKEKKKVDLCCVGVEQTVWSVPQRIAAGSQNYFMPLFWVRRQ